MKASSLPTLFIVCVLALLSCVALATKAGSTKVRTQAVAKVLHIAPPGKDGRRYVYVPFQIPPRTSRITISYSYDHANGTNALDIGLFDPRSGGSAGNLAGLRGWSGGRRADFFISRRSATPGYIPGELPAGKWRIILGLYRVASAGVDVSFNINIETDENISTSLATAPPLSTLSSHLSPPVKSEATQAEPAASAKQASLLRRWVGGDLHLHTVHSDGDWTIAGLVDAAREAGLDFICITDHNTFSHHMEIDRLPSTADSLLVMRGEEITTYGGHANAWGLPANTLIDFRVRPGDRAGMFGIVAQAHRHRALISINHPFALCVGCDWSYGQEAPRFDAIEVWNGAWDPTDERALAWWDQLRQKGRRITAIASSDSHRPLSSMGQPTTHLAVHGTLRQQTILNAVRAGQAYLTAEPRKPVIKFEARGPEDHATRSIGESLLLTRPARARLTIAADELPSEARVSLISHGQVIRSFSPKANGALEEFDVDCERNCYFRIEVRDKTGAMLALTNPIYVEIKKPR